jgi:hypothetical protein
MPEKIELPNGAVAYVKTSKEKSVENNKNALKTKHNGKNQSSDFSKADLDELIVKMARDLGYIN